MTIHIYNLHEVYGVYTSEDIDNILEIIKKLNQDNF